jgi:hypothetical protein
MSAGPRFVFVRFPSRDTPKLRPWEAHVHRVLGDVAEVRSTSSNDGVVVWQLVSANNRELVRGTELHDTFDEARTVVEALVSSGPSLRIELRSEANRGVYGWYLAAADRPVAACARWYGTQRDRRNSIDLALRSIAVASLNEGSRLTDPALMMRHRETLV